MIRKTTLALCIPMMGVLYCAAALSASQLNASSMNKRQDAVIYVDSQRLVYVDYVDQGAILVTKRDGAVISSRSLTWSPTHADMLHDGYIVALSRRNNEGLSLDDTRMEVHLINGKIWQPEFNPGDYKVSRNGESIVVIEEDKGQFYSSLYTREGVLVGRVPIPKQFDGLESSRIYKPSLLGKQIVEAPVPGDAMVSVPTLIIHEGRQLSESRRISIQDRLIYDAIVIDGNSAILMTQQRRIFGFGRYGSNWTGFPHPRIGGFSDMEVSPDGRYVLGFARDKGVFYVFDSETGEIIVKRDHKLPKEFEKEPVIDRDWTFLDLKFPLKQKSHYYHPRFTVQFDDKSRLLFTAPGKDETRYYIVALNPHETVRVASVPKGIEVIKNDGKLFVLDGLNAEKLNFVEMEAAQ